MNDASNAPQLSRIEDAGLNASAPPQQRWVDGWLVRYSPGRAKRARCVNAVSEGRLPLAQRLALCEQVFAEAGLPMIVRITPFTRPSALDGVLKANGMRRFDDTRVMLRAELGGWAPEALPPGVSIRSVDAATLAQAVGALRGSTRAASEAHAQRLLLSPVPLRAFELVVDGALAACGQLAIEHELVGLYDVFTAPPWRGRGFARLLCSHLLGQALAQGARHAYLQVEGDNHPARSVYRRLGFSDAYTYHYRTRDPGAA